MYTKDEFNMLAQLHSLGPTDKIVKVYDFVEMEDAHLMVCEELFLDLARLRERLKEKLTIQTSMKLMLLTLEAIAEVHRRGCVHGDIKPANFAVSKNLDRVVALDFGFSIWHLDGKTHHSSQEKEKRFRGTFSYASLRAHQFKPPEPSDDLWSFYFILLEFLGEVLPWSLVTHPSYQEVTETKRRALEDPDTHMWHKTSHMGEVQAFFLELKKAELSKQIDYDSLATLLRSLLKNSSVY